MGEKKETSKNLHLWNSKLSSATQTSHNFHHAIFLILSKTASIAIDRNECIHFEMGNGHNSVAEQAKDPGLNPQHLQLKALKWKVI